MLSVGMVRGGGDGKKAGGVISVRLTLTLCFTAVLACDLSGSVTGGWPEIPNCWDPLHLLFNNTDVPFLYIFYKCIIDPNSDVNVNLNLETIIFYNRVLEPHVLKERRHEEAQMSSPLSDSCLKILMRLFVVNRL